MVKSQGEAGLFGRWGHPMGVTGAEVTSWAQAQTAPVPSPKVVVRKVHIAVPGPRKPVGGAVTTQRVGISSAWDRPCPQPSPHSARPLLPIHVTHFPWQNANGEGACHPPFSGQKMDVRLFSEYTTNCSLIDCLLCIVSYAPALSALRFPARGVARQGIVVFILQMRKPSSEI